MSTQKGPLFGQRHVLACLASLGLAVSFSSRAAVSVVLVAMAAVNSSEHLPSESDGVENREPECPSDNSSWETPTRGFGEGLVISRELQGFILSSFYLGYLLLQVPGGMVAQRYGAKWILGGGILIVSLLNFLTPVCARASPYLMIGLLVLQGIGSSATFPSVLAMLGRWSPPQEASSLSTIAMSGPYLGTVVGQLLAGAVSSSEVLGGWPSVFYVNGALGLLWLLPWGFLVSNSPHSHPRITEEEKKYITAAVAGDQKEANKAGVPWRRILMSREVAVYLPICFCHGWVSYSMMTCLPQFLADVMHLRIFANGLVSCLPTISQVLLANAVTQASDRALQANLLSKPVVRKGCTLVGFWTFGLAFLGITLAGCSASAMLGLLVFGYATLGALYAGYFVTPLDVCPEFAGTVFALGNLFMTGAGVLSPLVVDVITSDRSRAAWMRVFYVSVTVAAVGGLLFLVAGSSRRRRWHVRSEEQKGMEERLTGKEEV